MTMTKSIKEQAMEYATQLETNHRAVMSNHPTSYYVGVEVGYESGAKARDAQWIKIVNELREALKKISDYSTLDGEKYNSYQDGWHGVADFAKRELTKADQMLKEMGISL